MDEVLVEGVDEEERPQDTNSTDEEEVTEVEERLEAPEAEDKQPGSGPAWTLSGKR